MRLKKFLALLLPLIVGSTASFAQATFPENGVADPRTGYYAFTHATVVKDNASTLTDATLVIRDGRIVSVQDCYSRLGFFGIGGIYASSSEPQKFFRHAGLRGNFKIIVQ